MVVPVAKGLKHGRDRYRRSYLVVFACKIYNNPVRCDAIASQSDTYFRAKQPGRVRI